MKKKILSILMLVIAVTVIMPVNAQNIINDNPIHIIDDPININEDLVGRYAVYNSGTEDAYILCEIWRKNTYSGVEPPIYTVYIKGDATHEFLTVIQPLHSSNAILWDENYITWKIPIPGMTNFEGTINAEKLNIPSLQINMPLKIKTANI
ncbi:MAG: hypothetical protein CVV28_01030 [Methanobacteriales archaeon HGW-Methanobacteriales-1]|jgi:hypothetical protein|nr:MAG: hypothetical protein CVV28_01030 [Methanobacteriales archaeon HGW-Methanobacteriales-1]